MKEALKNQVEKLKGKFANLAKLALISGVLYIIYMNFGFTGVIIGALIWHFC